MSCDRRRARFIEHMLAIAPDTAAAPTASALEKTFQDSCLPPRSAAERLTNEAKVQALFQLFGKIGVERPTHSKGGLPATDALCAGYARLYDELARRGQLELLSGALSPIRPTGQPSAAAVPHAPGGDAVAVQVAGAIFNVTGGRLADMLVAIRGLAGTSYQASSRTWIVPCSRADFDALLGASGWSASAPAPGNEPPADPPVLPSAGVSLPPAQLAPQAVGQAGEARLAQGAVKLSSSDQHEQSEHLKALRLTHTRRLRVLELQLARLGENYAPPHLVLEIEDTAVALRELDQQIGAFQRAPRVLDSKRAVVGLAQQRAIMQAIADIIGVPASEINLIDIVLGSIILTVEMSLVAAAQLMALHQAQHPRLAQMRLVGVELLAAYDSRHQPAKRALLRLADDTCSQIMAALPSDEQAFQLLIGALRSGADAQPSGELPGMAGAATLCLTLDVPADRSGATA